MRRAIARGLLALAFLVAPLSGAQAVEKRARLVLSGPGAAVSAPLIHLVDSGALADLADEVVFVPWRDPDQLRVMALDGQADILAMPTNVAANLYNRGAPVTLVNVSTWGVLWLLSRDPERRRLMDFRGEEIAVPFRGDMPDLLLQLTASKQGLDPRKDFRLRYVATPMDAMQLLLTRRVNHALLAEPAVSMALRKSRSFPVGLVAPELYRGADLQQEWGKVFARPARIPQAGIAAVGALRNDPVLMARIREAYAASLAWCRSQPAECGRLMARRIEMLSPEAVADALAVSQLDAVPAAAARAELEFFFSQLQARNPALIGGKLPAAPFYGPGQ